MGLAGMRDRVRMLGGEVLVFSPDEGGLAVEARFSAAEALNGRQMPPGVRADAEGNIPRNSG